VTGPTCGVPAPTHALLQQGTGLINNPPPTGGFPAQNSNPFATQVRVRTSHRWLWNE
jgi:hypothetical protein